MINSTFLRRSTTFINEDVRTVPCRTSTDRAAEQFAVSRERPVRRCVRSALCLPLNDPSSSSFASFRAPRSHYVLTRERTPSRDAGHFSPLHLAGHDRLKFRKIISA